MCYVLQHEFFFGNLTLRETLAVSTELSMNSWKFKVIVMLNVLKFQTLVACQKSQDK